MKRIICIGLVLLLAVVSSACGEAQPSASSAENEPVTTQAPVEAPVEAPGEAPADESAQEPNVGLPNPMVQYEDLEALQQEMGVLITIPAQSADVEYYLISGELAHIAFTYEGVPYVLRLKKTDAFSDISGVTADMTGTAEAVWGEISYQISYIEGEIGLSQWYDESTGCSYSIFMESAASADALNAITQSIIPVG